MRVAGIDGYKDGWIAVVVDSGDFASAFTVWATRLVDVIRDNAIRLALIDMPIGLSSGPVDRPVEAAARQVLQGKASSLFNAPCRQALGCASYASASQMNADVLGKKLSKQTWNICPKIAEADHAAQSLTDVVLHEAHPEVSFATFTGAPIVASKKSVKGLVTRAGHMARLGFDLVKLAAPLNDKHTASPDDLIDAAILAWSATRVQMNTHVTFPSQPSRDAMGLEMAIYA
jgi:predicted RNase H-like nuclease